MLIIKTLYKNTKNMTVTQQKCSSKVKRKVRKMLCGTYREWAGRRAFKGRIIKETKATLARDSKKRAGEVEAAYRCLIAGTK